MIVGIDLGTTNSGIGFWKDGEHVAIPNALGHKLTPSVISIDENGDVLVGEPAKARLISHPERSVSQFKRSMGSAKRFKLADKNFDATELSSILLSALKKDAEAFLNQPITNAVISVPAYFNDQQRKATRIAAELAGLNVDRLINEPTAAAIAYGLSDQADDVHYLVLDLGGGTFDVTLLEYFDGVMEVHATAGDNHLGGEDFTHALVKKVIEQHQLKAINDHQKQQLYAAMEVMKLELAAGRDATSTVKFNDQTLDIAYTASEFEKITQDLIKRIIDPVGRVIRDANLSPADIHKVILVGGASRMFAFKQAITKMLRQLPQSHLDPDLVVTIGAGIQAGMVANDEAFKEVVLTDVTPYSLGVGIHNAEDEYDKVGDIFSPIIDRNTVVPVSRVQTYYTVHKHQTTIQFHIYQGESRFVRNNTEIGRLEVKVPKNDAGKETVDVRFSYDMNGILDVDVLVNSTGKRINKVFEQTNTDLSDEEKAKTLEKLGKLKIHPRDTLVNRNLQARLEKLYEMSIGEQRDYIDKLSRHLDAAFNTQDEKKIKVVREELEPIVADMERDWWK